MVRGNVGAKILSQGFFDNIKEQADFLRTGFEKSVDLFSDRLCSTEPCMKNIVSEFGKIRC